MSFAMNAFSTPSITRMDFVPLVRRIENINPEGTVKLL
jgi:hypothetical protein